MAYTLISGNLTDQSGAAQAGARIIIVAQRNSSAAFSGMTVSQVTGPEGEYSFSLAEGYYRVAVSYNNDRRTVSVGDMKIESNSEPGTLNDYVRFADPVLATPTIYSEIKRLYENAQNIGSGLENNVAVVIEQTGIAAEKANEALSHAESAAAANGEALKAKEDALSAKDLAVQASDQAKATIATAGLKKDVSTGLAETTNGQFFSVAQGPEAKSAIITYRNDNGSATEVSRVAGTTAVLAVEDEQARTAQEFDDTWAFEGEDSDELPVITDSSLRVLVGLNHENQRMKAYGRELANSDDIVQLPALTTAADDSWAQDDISDGQILELVDSAGRVIKSLDTATQSQYIFGKKVLTEAYKAPTTWPELADIRSYGQSLSVSFGTDAGIETPVVNSYMFNGGIATYNKGTTSFVSLANTTQRQYHETSLINQLQRNDPDQDRKYLAAASGVEGYSMAQLEPGTDPFTKFMATIDQAVALAEARGWQYGMPALTFFQGEADAYNGTGYDYYRGKMRLIQSTVNQKVKNVSRNPSDVPMIIYQMASHGRYEGLSYPSSDIPLAQFDEAVGNPLIQLCTPMYQFPYLDGVHLHNHGYRWLGLYREKALRHWIETGKPWLPLHPTAVYKVGARTVVADFHVPVGNLQFRTDIVSQATDGMNGFELWSGATRLAIASVQIMSGNKVKVTATADFTGAVQLAYAFTPENRGDNDGAGRYPSWNAGPTTGVRGNLCDSDNSTTDLLNADGKPYPLQNYCVIFKKEAK